MLVKIIIIVLGGLTSMAYARSEREAIDTVRQSLKIEGPVTAELLAGGLSGSTLFKVKTLEQIYVVRFWNTEWPEWFSQDLTCQIVASSAGYGPKLFFTDEGNYFSIMEYLEPETYPEKEILFQKLANLLNQIHNGPAVPKGFDRSIELDDSIKDVAALTISYLDIALIQRVKNAIFNSIQYDARLVPCHRDLHPRNIIFSKERFFAVDYTWGGMDDPYGDLAAVAIFNCKTFKEELRLLELYLKQVPSAKEIARFSLIKTLTKIFYSLELLKLAPKHLLTTRDAVVIEKNYLNFAKNSEALNPDYFLGYGLSLLAEALSYIHSENYIQDIALVSSP